VKVKCVPCLGTGIKDAIHQLGDSVLDQALDKIPECPGALEIELCAKPPRVKSEYQIFISDCMKSKPIKGKPFGEASKYMKECAVVWNKRKEERSEAKNSH